MKTRMERALEKTNDRVIAMGADPGGIGVEADENTIGLLYIGLPVTSDEANELIEASVMTLGHSIATGQAGTPVQGITGMLHSVLVAGIMIGLEAGDDAG